MRDDRERLLDIVEPIERNILVHAYFGIDLVLVWAAVQSDLPSLKKQTVRLIDSSPA